MKKVLVMGGSYFIGKHVVNLLKNIYEVYVLNRGNNPFNDTSVHELICDRNQSSQLKAVLAPYLFNYIVDISGYNENQSTILINALNLKSLEKFVYISTSAVYNRNILTPPFKETDILGGDSPFKEYARHKIEAESYLLKHIDKDKLIIFRPPLVYGEDNYILRERLAFHLIEKNLPVYVPASDNRISFIYVKDLAREVHLSFEGIIPAGIYNVGSKVSLSFTQWVNLCAKVMKKDASIVYVDASHPSLDVRYFFPFFDYDNILSVDKLKKYVPDETLFETGLKNAYNDYLTLNDTLQMTEQMLLMREKIANIINENKF